MDSQHLGGGVAWSCARFARWKETLLRNGAGERRVLAWCSVEAEQGNLNHGEGSAARPLG